MNLSRIIAAGTGSIVLVEGTPGKDDHVYGRWFGTLAREVTFQAAGSRAEVVEQLDSARSIAPYMRSFALIDRDFSDDATRAALAARGIHCGTRYTIENYLLDPEPWHRVADVRRCGKPFPSGWSSVDEVAQRIDDAYKQCLCVAAFNRTAHAENLRVSGNGYRYACHPKGLDGLLPKLVEWGVSRGAPRGLDGEFESHLRILGADRTSWPAAVTGKAVLGVFLEAMNLAFGQQIQPELAKSMYVAQQTTAPTELESLVGRFL